KPYVFYIEGDGFAFKNGFPTEDPTPTSPVFFNLAVADARANVVYMARPCQYTPMELNPACSTEFWHRKRMSEEVVASINDAINKIRHNKPFSIIGYSGGGGIAVLVSARNRAAQSIITVAGNL